MRQQIETLTNPNPHTHKPKHTQTTEGPQTLTPTIPKGERIFLAQAFNIVFYAFNDSD